jgi:hypothetical protein
MSRILIEDQTLIDRLSINDTDAFEELYHRYWSGLYLYCVKKLQSSTDARIIVRDIFIAIWEKRNELPVTFSISRHLYEEVRKQVVKSLNQKLADANDAACMEPWLSKEFSVAFLQAAKNPVRKKVSVINKPSELIRQQTNMMSEPEGNTTLTSLKWMFHSLTSKLSLTNILSYNKN